MTCAADRGAELVTLEHLLFALVEDEDASELLNACSVDINKLKSELDDFMINTLDKKLTISLMKYSLQYLFKEFFKEL